jgi:hypothetical protein
MARDERLNLRVLRIVSAVIGLLGAGRTATMTEPGPRFDGAAILNDTGVAEAGRRPSSADGNAVAAPSARQHGISRSL